MTTAKDEDMTNVEFKAFPKVPRLFRDCVITEKIDGTNAAVGVLEDGTVYAQSRKRIITPQDDNYGFAKWVADHKEMLKATLGPGLHFGEWWGASLQRGYGLVGERRFSLFNVARWESEIEEWNEAAGLFVVPVLWRGPYNLGVVSTALNELADHGSMAAPGFMDPEGIMTYHEASGQLYKTTIKDDAEPKGFRKPTTVPMGKLDAAHA